MTSASATYPLDSVSYEDLYRRWETGNWRATEIDISRDRGQWRDRFSELERKAARWNYGLFFWGEDAVADGLSPYIDAAPLAFLVHSFRQTGTNVPDCSEDDRHR